MKAIESSGFLDDKGILKLDKPTKLVNQRVKVILLFAEEDKFENEDWVQAIAKNPVFDFLKDESQDIYSMNDGKPISGEI